MIKTKKIVEIYSDGSGNTADSDGGWGFVVVIDGCKQFENSNYVPNATNNEAELMAAIRGLEYATDLIINQGINKDDCEFVLISDSQLVLNYTNGKWKCKAVHLKPKRDRLREYYNWCNLETRWVKGHSGNIHNERCDVIAGIARRNGRAKRTSLSLFQTLSRFRIIKSRQDFVRMVNELNSLYHPPGS